MSAMRRLIYASRWTPTVHADVELALQQIVARSIQNNRVDNLTGFLLAFDGVFLQVLEGPPAAITATYARISADPRHERLTVVSDQAAEARSFRDWNMCGVSLERGDALLTESRMTQMAARGGFDPAAALELLQSVALLEAERERTAALA